MAIALTLLAGIGIGMVNGVLVGFVGLNALIVTLAMLSFLQGLVLFYSGGSNVNVQNAQTTWFAVFGRRDAFRRSGSGADFPDDRHRGGFLSSTGPSSAGRSFAVGGNETAARFSGIGARWTVFWAYALSGLTTAIAAIIMGSRVMGAQNTIGQGYELTVLAGVILGGTSLFGGSGSIWRTVLGITMLGFIQNGLLLLGYPYYVQWLVTWAVIILAVWVDLGAKRGRILA